MPRNFYLNENNFKIADPSTLIPHQVNITQADFHTLLLQQLEELWSSYHPIHEMWFDGGISDSLRRPVTDLLHKYLPNALVFNGWGFSDHPSKWVGTESGLPTGPIWSTGTSGQGDPMGSDFVPTTCDTTITENRVWFYKPRMKVRSLKDLINVYHSTVGNNCVLELGFVALPSGEIPADQVERAKELGDWIRTCYDTPVADFTPEYLLTAANNFTLHAQFDAPTTIDRFMLQEVLSEGQGILEYRIEVAENANGPYVKFASGFSVGQKAIVIGKRPVKALFVNLFITRSRGAVLIRTFSAFAPCRFGEKDVELRAHVIIE
eukprot:GEMP01035354.1.p1 GENE.GEMP01035354.1~~GEMP01035354.1.p1  ORF type:complete len:321 (+),score=58.09 GEMP01035354.1:783-1745(+)